MSLEKSSFWTQSLQTFMQNSGKTNLLSLTTIPAELGVEYLLKLLGANKTLSEGLGFAAGFGTSVGVGCIAGPIGGLVGGGSYLIGKGVGFLVNSLFFRKRIPSTISPNNNMMVQVNTLDENSLRQIYILISQEYRRYPEIFREKYLNVYVNEIYEILQNKYLDRPLNFDTLEDFTLEALEKLIEKNVVNIIEIIGMYYPGSNYVEVLKRLKNELDKLKDIINLTKFPRKVLNIFKLLVLSLLNGGKLSDSELYELIEYFLKEILKFIKEEFKLLENYSIGAFIDKFIDNLSNDLLNYKLNWEFEKLIFMLTLLVAYQFNKTVQELKDCFN